MNGRFKSLEYLQPPKGHAGPGSASATPDRSTFSENLDQMVLDTSSAAEGEQNSPVNSAPSWSSRMALRKHLLPSY